MSDCGEDGSELHKDFVQKECILTGIDCFLEPDVIPLQVSGTIDTDLSKVTASELMAWGLPNLWKQDEEGGYAVRHGRQPVNEMRESNREIIPEFSGSDP